MEQFDTVGNAVRAARRQRGWSQARLGKQAGVPQSHIAMLEAGKDVRMSTLLRVTAAIGYDLSFQPREPAPDNPPADSALARAERYGVDLASLYRSARMSPAER